MASKLDAAREYVLTHYHNGNDFRWDELSRKLQVRAIGDGLPATGGEVWQDVDTRMINSIACDCAQALQMNITDREIRLVLNSKHIPSIHPLRDYLHSLEPYDPEANNHSWIDWLAGQVRVANNANEELNRLPQTKRLLLNDEMMNCCNPQGWWKYCFKKWFVAMVASWLFDEVANHEVIVLIGRQGIYKTSWLEHLMPPCLRAYCTTMSNPHDLNKDERMRIAEFGLICMEELDALNKRELNQTKALVTCTNINERGAYEYTKTRRVRVASFCGSGNDSQILTDDTGNRRWLLFDVESIESPFNYPDSIFPYDQIYGEALFLIEQHFCYWFDQDDIQSIEQHNAKHVRPQNESDLLRIYFTPANPGDNGAIFMTTAEISARLKDYGNITSPMNLSQLSRVIQSKGFPLRRTHDSKGFVVYINQDLDNQRRLAAREAVLESDYAGPQTEETNASGASDASDVF